MKIKSTSIVTLACFSILAGWRIVDAAPPTKNPEGDLEKLVADFAAHEADASAHQTRYTDAEAQAALAPTVEALIERLDVLQEYLIVSEARIEALEATLAPVRLEQGAMNGLPGPHLIFEGCNVHVRGGTGATGLGNLIQGFNDDDFNEL